jgi:hypothetical protein
MATVSKNPGESSGGSTIDHTFRATAIFRVNAQGLEIMICPLCGILFGVPDNYLLHRCAAKKEMYCPNGCGLSFTDPPADDATGEPAFPRITHVK